MIQIPSKLERPIKFQGCRGERGGFIKFSAHLRAYAVYHAIYGNSQTAERLADRGGFGIDELNAFYPEWRNHIIKK